MKETAGLCMAVNAIYRYEYIIVDLPIKVISLSW